MSTIVEPLAFAHLGEWGVDVEAPDFVGFVTRGTDGALTSIALATWIPEPVDPSYPAGWWVWFDSRGPVSPLAHRYALKIRDALQAAGAQHIHAFMEADIPRAEAWMKRLGFVPWKQEVWRLSLVVDCEGRRAGRAGSGGERAGQAAAGHS